MTPPSPFDKFVDKVKSGTKVAAEQMKLAGRITALNVEKTTQKTERDRLLREIGSKTYRIYNKTKSLDADLLTEEITSELNHLERIDQRIQEIDVEISQLRAEYVARNEGKDIVDADVESSVEDEDEEKGEGNQT